MAIAQWAADTKFRPRPRPLVEFSKTTPSETVARFDATWAAASRKAGLNSERIEWMLRRWSLRRQMPENAAILRHSNRDCSGA